MEVLRKIIPLLLFRRLQPAYHFLLAWLASVWYRNPSRGLTVVGVTGTNGKTTVVHLLHEIFRSAGHSVGSISSLRFKVNDAERPNLLKMTMPGRFELQKFLARCRDAGCRFVILEVTSEGIKQYRHRFIRFSAAVLTNVTPEHIESHGSFEAYREAKMQLFLGLAPSANVVLNEDDDASALIASRIRQAPTWFSRGAIHLDGMPHPVRVERVGADGIVLRVDGIEITLPLGGGFNVENVLAAIATGMTFGIPLAATAEALSEFRGVPGRLDFIQREPFAVVVDYAHTPDALEKVYITLSGGNAKRETRNAKLICVFGSAGGGRDKWKRPEMGKIAARYCKEVILTSEDPDDENPAGIIAEIESGIAHSSFPIPQIIDRREAIRAALRDAKPGDTVIITGMGAQPWFIERGKKIPWDEPKIVREELDRMK